MNQEDKCCDKQPTMDYDNTFVSNGKSRDYLKIAAAYVNVATRARLNPDEFKLCTGYSINETKARAFSVMTNLAFASEVALKGKLPDEKLEEIPWKDRHNLKILFNIIPKCEQEQIRMIMQTILGCNEEEFDSYMEECQEGFKEWRYFFEKKNEGETYNYTLITMFLYALAYCLITGEGTDEILEPCGWKKRCFVGQWGFYEEQQKIKKEYEQARKTALEYGNGIITPEDEKWLQSIQDKLEKVETDIKRLENEYTKHNRITVAYIPSKSSL